MAVYLRLAYDGSDFHGYARQRPRADGSAIRTVQEVLEVALAVLYRGHVATRSASRTDAGVHAEGQLVMFEAPYAIPVAGLARGLNARLPADVRVLAAWTESRDLDVRRDNGGKHYRYQLRRAEIQPPDRARYEWLVLRPLDLEAMRAAAARFAGRHDFASFRASACQAQTSERTVHRVEIAAEPCGFGPIGDVGRLDDAHRPPPQRIAIDVRGQAFLHNMVRIMVGSLVDVGLGKREPDWISHLLAHPDRRQAGMTAPAHGLTLVEVSWPHAPSA